MLARLLLLCLPAARISASAGAGRPLATARVRHRPADGSCDRGGWRGWSRSKPVAVFGTPIASGSPRQRQRGSRSLLVAAKPRVFLRWRRASSVSAQAGGHLEDSRCRHFGRDWAALAIER